MERGNMASRLFWGSMFISVGILALLQNYGLDLIDLDRFWPVFLIIIGLWLTLHRYRVEGPAPKATRKRR